MNEFVTEHVTADDGVTIGYRVLGDGPPVVLVHGSVATADDWMAVAGELAGRHRCYVLDRRGRGASADAADYDLGTEAGDIAAVLEVAGDEAILLGHSYGAICALEAVRLGATPRGLVLYEPPLPYESPTAGEYLQPFTEAVERGDRDEAMVIACDHFLRVSREETEAFRASPIWPHLVGLTPTWSRELREIDLTTDRLDDYARLALPTLLLVGSHTPDHLAGAVKWLAALMPDVTVDTLPEQGHFANHLAPQLVGEAISGFAAAHA